MSYDPNIVEIIIPDGVTEIKKEAFKNYVKLEIVVIPNSVTRIGDSAFYNCLHLKNVKIPDSVKHIGVSAFTNCLHLENVEIPDSVKHIGESAFSNCTSLKKIKLPNSITEINKFLFMGCKKLKSIEMFGVKHINNFAFKDCFLLFSILLPDTYNIIVDDLAFNNCDSIHTIKFNNKYNFLFDDPKIYYRSIKSSEDKSSDDISHFKELVKKILNGYGYGIKNVSSEYEFENYTDDKKEFLIYIKYGDARNVIELHKNFNGDDDIMNAFLNSKYYNEEIKNEILDCLLNMKNININLKNDNGKTALMLNIHHIEIVKKLLNRKDIDVNLQDNSGITALMKAFTVNENYDIINSFLDRKDLNINFNLKDNRGHTIFMYACRFGHTWYVDKFFNTKDINEKNIRGETPFFIAAKNKHYSICKIIINKSNNEFLNNAYDSFINHDFIQVCLMIISKINETESDILIKKFNSFILSGCSDKDGKDDIIKLIEKEKNKKLLVKFLTNYYKLIKMINIKKTDMISDLLDIYEKVILNKVLNTNEHSIIVSLKIFYDDDDEDQELLFYYHDYIPLSAQHLVNNYSVTPIEYLKNHCSTSTSTFLSFKSEELLKKYELEKIAPERKISKRKLESANESQEYKKKLRSFKKELDKNANDCVICLNETKNMKKLKCGCEFPLCEDCERLNKLENCPICRKPIDDSGKRSVKGKKKRSAKGKKKRSVKSKKKRSVKSKKKRSVKRKVKSRKVSRRSHYPF